LVPNGWHVDSAFLSCELSVLSMLVVTLSISVSSSGDQATFVASGSGSLQKYTNVANRHLLQK
jgi:hypothetical protein